MTPFIVVGALGLVLLLVALPLDDVLDLGDGAVSGTSLGAGAVAFGAIGAIVTANELPTAWAYVLSIVFAILVIIGVQRLVGRLKATEDGQPHVLTGVQGVVTATVTPSGAGEVSLDDPRELERRLAWADQPIDVGARVVVVEQSGSRVKVVPVATTAHDGGPRQPPAPGA